MITTEDTESTEKALVTGLQLSVPSVVSLFRLAEY